MLTQLQATVKGSSEPEVKIAAWANVDRILLSRLQLMNVPGMPHLRPTQLT